MKKQGDNRAYEKTYDSCQGKPQSHRKTGSLDAHLTISSNGLQLKGLSDGIVFSVKVQPRSSRSEVVGLQGGYLKIKVSSPPVSGRANRQCLGVFAKWLQVRTSQLEIVSGHGKRVKVIKVTGDPDILKDKLRTCLQERVSGP